jgi:hypothetical protein
VQNDELRPGAKYFFATNALFPRGLSSQSWWIRSPNS